MIAGYESWKCGRSDSIFNNLAWGTLYALSFPLFLMWNSWNPPRSGIQQSGMAGNLMETQHREKSLGLGVVSVEVVSLRLRVGNQKGYLSGTGRKIHGVGRKTETTVLFFINMASWTLGYSSHRLGLGAPVTLLAGTLSCLVLTWLET